MQASASPFAHLAGQAAALAAQLKPAVALTTAEQIVAAGRKRRGEIAYGTAPAQGVGHTATAAEIVAAGKRARGEA